MVADRAGSGRTPARSIRYLQILLLVAVVGVLNFGGAWFAEQIDLQIFPRHDSMLHVAILVAIAAYFLLMVIPFLPGIEVGLALMMTLGSKGALLVYLCTLAALASSFAIGRMIPSRPLCLLLDWLHLHRAGALLRQMEPLDARQRIAFLDQQAPARIAPFLLKHRLLAIAAALNLPGNSLLGGGGGIGLLVGMSGVVPFRHYLLVVAIAVAPVPLFFFLFGR
jgi:hypothetical protein